jgi:hypothetical protein
MTTNSDLPTCFAFHSLTKDEIYAIKALKTGEATPEQQMVALRVIVNKFSRTHDLLFVPECERQSAFLNGRAFVGTQVLKILNVPIGKLLGEDNVHTQV